MLESSSSEGVSIYTHSTTFISSTYNYHNRASSMAERSNSFSAVNDGELSSSFQRSNSFASENSQTAQDFISSQLQLELDAREALPYQFDTCTKPLGPLRQLLFACLTCNPPPDSPTDPYTPAGVCYSCSISCHGEHTLVELFNKRNFVCDCGTTRIPDSAPCTLRINETTGIKGGVSGEEAVKDNRYNQNFRNRFCGCGEVYDAHQEKGTMFQCLGLGTVEEGGCGEDWWHPECIVGLERRWYEKSNGQDASEKKPPVDGAQSKEGATQNDVAPNGAAGEAQEQDDQAPTDDPPTPPGFPDEDEFEHFICYKCVEANPWIKRYAGATGFLPAVFHKPVSNTEDPCATSESNGTSRKRKAEDDEDDSGNPSLKKQRGSEDDNVPADTQSSVPQAKSTCKYATLPAASSGQLSLFVKEDFREHFCRCPDCFPRLRPFPQLLEEEDTYEPPISEDGDAGTGGQSVGTGSLLERGEAALSNVDRVRAIEGVMVYNHLKDKVKSFLQPFAESGQAVGAEDIKAYFEKLRGDAEGMKEAAAGASGNGENGDDGSGDNRKEQSGEYLL